MKQINKLGISESHCSRKEALGREYDVLTGLPLTSNLKQFKHRVFMFLFHGSCGWLGLYRDLHRREYTTRVKDVLYLLVKLLCLSILRRPGPKPKKPKINQSQIDLNEKHTEEYHHVRGKLDFERQQLPVHVRFDPSVMSHCPCPDQREVY